LLLISHIGGFGLIFAEFSYAKNHLHESLLAAHQLRLRGRHKVTSSILLILACISSWIKFP